MYRYRWTLALLAFIAHPADAQAQDSMDWTPWNRPGYVASSYRAAPVDEDRMPPSEIDRAPAVLDGGPRPPISPIRPEQVDFISTYAPSTIVIDTAGRRLYLVRSPTTALVYPISVGREGFTWTGTEIITRIADWPD